MLEKEAALLQARARVLQIAAEFSHNNNSDSDQRSIPMSAIARFEKLSRTITDNYRSPIRGAEIAASAGMHHSSAMRLFRQVSGMSIHEFMTSLWKESPARADLVPLRDFTLPLPSSANRRRGVIDSDDGEA